MFSWITSIKTVTILFVLLVASGLMNYSLYNKTVEDKIFINQQKQSIEELNKSNKFKDEVKGVTDNTFKQVITDIESNKQSFDSVKDKLKNINCNKQEAKVETKKNEHTKEIPNSVVDPDVTAYYDILQSAYSLQNQD